MKHHLRVAIPFAFFFSSMSLAALGNLIASSAGAPNAQKGADSFRFADHPYHKHAPKGVLPNTLEPEQFKNTPEVYVAYSLAAKIRTLLYQEPCLCPCGKQRGHKSLLDCFTGLHGRNCDECKLQVFFCYEQNNKGWSAKKIRKAMCHFQFLGIDFHEYAQAQWRAITGAGARP